MVVSAAQGLLRDPLPGQTLLWGWGGGKKPVLISPPLCSIFKPKPCKKEYSAFCLLSVRKVASSMRPPPCPPGRGTLPSPLLSFPPIGIIADPPDPWALLSQVLFKRVVTLFRKVIYKSLYNSSKETGREGPNGGCLVSGWWKGWNFFPIKLIKMKQSQLHKACHSG